MWFLCEFICVFWVMVIYLLYMYSVPTIIYEIFSKNNIGKR